MTIFLRFTVLILSLYFSTLTLADTVWMKNGDQLTGKITLLSNGKLVLNTDYAGDITISWAKVSTIKTERELLVTNKNYQKEKTHLIEPAKEGKIVLVNGKKEEINLTDITEIATPQPIIEDLVWTGKINISLDSKKTDTTTSSVDVDFQTKAVHGKWRHNISGEYNRKSSNGKVSANDYELNYALDRFITQQWYWQGNLKYRIDHVDDIHKQYTLGTGPGYQFWDNSLGSFSLTSPLSLMKYEYSNGNSKTFSSVGVNWDYSRYLFGKNIELFSTGDFYRPLSNTVANYALNADIGIRYRLTDWASLNMKLSRNYVDAKSDGGTNETRYLIGFGINW